MRGSNSQKRPRRHQTGRGDPFSLPLRGPPAADRQSGRDPGVIRSFGGFQAAASQAALCRIFAGQYTMIDLGRQLGRHAGDFGLGHFGLGHFGLGHFGHGASRRSPRKAHSRSRARPARTAPAAAAQVKG
jgi:hypothetical protein